MILNPAACKEIGALDEHRGPSTRLSLSSGGATPVAEMAASRDLASAGRGIAGGVNAEIRLSIDGTATGSASGVEASALRLHGPVRDAKVVLERDLPRRVESASFGCEGIQENSIAFSCL